MNTSSERVQYSCPLRLHTNSAVCEEKQCEIIALRRKSIVNALQFDLKQALTRGLVWVDSRQFVVGFAANTPLQECLNVQNMVQIQECMINNYGFVVNVSVQQLRVEKASGATCDFGNVVPDHPSVRTAGVRRMLVMRVPLNARRVARHVCDAVVLGATSSVALPILLRRAPVHGDRLIDLVYQVGEKLDDSATNLVIAPLLDLCVCCEVGTEVALRNALVAITLQLEASVCCVSMLFRVVVVDERALVALRQPLDVYSRPFVPAALLAAFMKPAWQYVPAGPAPPARALSLLPSLPERAMRFDALPALSANASAMARAARTVIAPYCRAQLDHLRQEVSARARVCM
jgi:hypothetical protein